MNNQLLSVCPPWFSFCYLSLFLSFSVIYPTDVCVCVYIHTHIYLAGPCGILVPQPGIEPLPPAVEAQSFNHWTAREVPIQQILYVTLTMYCSHIMVTVEIHRDKAEIFLFP